VTVAPQGADDWFTACWRRLHKEPGQMENFESCSHYIGGSAVPEVLLARLEKIVRFSPDAPVGHDGDHAAWQRQQ